MDRTQLKQVLETVVAVVTSHGIMSNMSPWNRERIPVNFDNSDGVGFDFNLDPTRSAWDSNNFSCSLKFTYVTDSPRNVDGGTYRDYRRRISFGTSGTDVDLSLMKTRENLMNSLIMVAEMLESLTPQRITLTVESPEEAASRRQKEHEQVVGGQIFAELEKSSLRNLRKGGKPRLVRFEKSTGQPVGSYRYEHVRRYNRRGYAVDKVNYRFIVVSDSLVKVYRTA